MRTKRTNTERHNNPHQHDYRFDSLSRCHICEHCGTAEHRNGDYWWAGRFSQTEPPCDNQPGLQKEWYQTANKDPELML